MDALFIKNVHKKKESLWKKGGNVCVCDGMTRCACGGLVGDTADDLG